MYIGILTILYWSQAATVSQQEYTSLKACMEAKSVVESQIPKMERNVFVSMHCVKK